MIVDPAGEDRRFHSDHPGLGKGSDPCVQFAPRRSDLAFLLDLACGVLHAIADRLLVHIQSDVSNRKCVPARPSLSRYIVNLARLGAYLACAHDPPPGNTVIWIGLSRLTDTQLGIMIGVQLVSN